MFLSSTDLSYFHPQHLRVLRGNIIIIIIIIIIINYSSGINFRIMFIFVTKGFQQADIKRCVTCYENSKNISYFT